MWFVFFHTETQKWNGTGEVSLFPDSESTKNYRLSADMDIEEKRHGWFHSEYIYTVKTTTWPNGGYSTFTNCIIHEDRNQSCDTDDGKQYTVEVIRWPDMPEDENSPNWAN